MSEKKKIRFNVIDAIVILVILSVAVFVGSKLFGGGKTGPLSTDNVYEMTFYIEEAPDFAAKAIENGSAVTDEAKNVPLGKVVSAELKPSVIYAPNSNGESVKSSKEGYNSVTLVAEVSGTEFEHGLEIGNVKYVVGHTMTLYAGKAKLYGRIAGIEKK